MQPLVCTTKSSLSNSEIEIAKSQVSKQEFSIAAKFPALPLHSTVCLPPKNTGENDRWVLFNFTSNEIADVVIQQPDPGRTAVLAPLCKPLPYCYADQLRGILALSIILTIILSVISTPLVLLCCVPMIWGIKKVCTVTIISACIREQLFYLKTCRHEMTQLMVMSTRLGAL